MSENSNSSHNPDSPLSSPPTNLPEDFSQITDPNKLQRIAADPWKSVWVSASAGSGKTKVLTDRVLSLLLTRALPDKILCITFTKAAAAEMANRVNKRLGKWATMEESTLRDELVQLMGINPDESDIRLARQLFARVLDTPGGLKILTLHSFCQSLLGRFPLEAGVSPNFQILDDRSTQEMLLRAQDLILQAADTIGPLQSALKIVTRHSNEESFADLMQKLIYERGRLKRLLQPQDGETSDQALARAEEDIYSLLDAKPDMGEEDVIEEACAEGAFDRAQLREAMLHLMTGTKTDQATANSLDSWLAKGDAQTRMENFHDYRGAFLTQSLAPRSKVMTKKLSDARPDLEEVLRAEQDRMMRVQDKIARQVTATGSIAIIRLGDAMLRAYEVEKQARDLLDFDDLILKTVQLLTRDDGAAAWVMFKLDGGLDHVLIDEAQDTNPEQWQVVESLTREFYAGEGQYDTRPDDFAAEMPRTIFAVGDEKQSIFSFQRADPKEFRRMQQVFDQLVTSADQKWALVPMDTSFRSAQTVLKLVDAVFEDPAAKDGVVTLDHNVKHHAFREGHGGKVELWPVVQEDRPVDPAPWMLPTEIEKDSSPKQRLAEALAAQIQNWIGQEELPSQGRPVQAGDIMILVRKRDVLVDMLVRSLKRRQIPVAGVDRMVLSEQIVVMDLMVLAQFLILPDDDLSLATVLKSPLIGLNDDDLFELAHGRGKRRLWQNLRNFGADHPRFGPAVRWLSNLLSRTDFIRPFELFSSILSQTCPALDRQEKRDLTGREALVARLGREIEDPLEEFMGICLTYEQGNAPSLQGFIHWFHAGEAVIKRDLEAGDRGEVRIMTAHGSKGLQAPIVILPDTTSLPGTSREVPIRWVTDEAEEDQPLLPVWTPKANFTEAVGEKAKTALKAGQMQEYRRLLYVAMTRAEDRLLICGAAGKNKLSDDCWYSLMQTGIEKIGQKTDFKAPLEGEDGWSGEAWAYQEEHVAEIKVQEETQSVEKTQDIPDWMRIKPGAEPLPPRPLIPSAATSLDQAQSDLPVRSPRKKVARHHFKRGNLVHRLLQSLPDLPSEHRRTAALRFLAQPAHGLEADYQQELTDEVIKVMEHPDFQSLFGSDSRAEVPVVGLVDIANTPQIVSGQIDRLVVTGKDVFIVDYKTLRPSPMDPADIPEVYIKQMASYRSVLKNIYPNHHIRCAILWTDGPRIIELNKGQLDLIWPTP